MKVEQVLKRVSGLNPDAGEIGPGMLRTIVQEATEALVELATMNERIRELEQQIIDSELENTLIATHLTAEREVSDKLEKVLSSVQLEFYQYTEGFTILWDEIDAALAEVAAIRAKQK